MIKRTHKITSLLVAAAAMVSLVPSTGVSAAERLGTKEGTIESAIAFDGGKYIFKGYKTEDDDQAIYYNNGEKDKLLEDVEDYDGIEKYGEKYAKVTDNGDDEYLVDLSTGKISDDETSEDIRENLETKLKSTLSKTDRYGKIQSGNIKAEEISKESFSDTWFKYTATTSGSATAKLYGFTNKSGKYVDASYLANMSVVNGDNVVKVENFGKEKNGVTVTLNSIDAIAQDKDNIYTITKVNVTTSGSPTAVPKQYIQKISKIQGDKEEDAYLPKKVESYEISEAYDSDDADKAAKVLKDLIDAPTSKNVRVIKGNLYITTLNASEDNITVTSLKLKKDKVKFNKEDKNDTKYDLYLVEKDTDDDQDIAGKNAFSIDVDGNTWALNKGTIYKFDGKEFKSIYTCDRSLDTLDVYNEKSLIAWEEGEDVYTTVQEGSSETDSETTPAQTGWFNTAAGWTFYDAAGKQVVGSWVNAGGVWYMIKADGIMATGWYNDNGTWYYLQSSGAMKTGWFNDNGTWYFLNASGAMQTGWQYVNGSWYYLNPVSDGTRGAMKTGWLNDNGTWYYLSESGAMLSNTTINGYKLGANGAWIR